MSNIVGLDLKIDQNYIEEAVKQTVIVGISEALNGKNEIVSQIVHAALTQKVDKNGCVSSYSSDNKYTILELYVKKLIQGVLKEELDTVLEEKRPEIQKVIRTELQKKVNTEKFVGAFFSTVSAAINATWCPRIDVVFDKAKDD